METGFVTFVTVFWSKFDVYIFVWDEWSGNSAVFGKL